MKTRIPLILLGIILLMILPPQVEAQFDGLTWTQYPIEGGAGAVDQDRGWIATRGDTAAITFLQDGDVRVAFIAPSGPIRNTTAATGTFGLPQILHLNDTTWGVVYQDAAPPSQARFTKTHDDGITWTASVTLPTSIQGYAIGTFMAGNSTTLSVFDNSADAHAFSTNQGASWTSRTDASCVACTGSSLTDQRASHVRDGNSLHMNYLGYRSADQLVRVRSNDGGATNLDGAGFLYDSAMRQASGAQDPIPITPNSWLVPNDDNVGQWRDAMYYWDGQEASTVLAFDGSLGCFDCQCVSALGDDFAAGFILTDGGWGIGVRIGDDYHNTTANGNIIPFSGRTCPALGTTVMYVFWSDGTDAYVFISDRLPIAEEEEDAATRFFGSRGPLYGGDKERMAQAAGVTIPGLDIMYSIIVILILTALGFTVANTMGATFGAGAGAIITTGLGWMPIWAFIFILVLSATLLTLLGGLRNG